MKSLSLVLLMLFAASTNSLKIQEEKLIPAELAEEITLPND